MSRAARLVLISDSHGFHADLTVPEGDILVHAGDLTMRGRLDELREANRWLACLPHPFKIAIAGNHDFCFEEEPEEARRILTAAIYLQDDAVEVGGLRFWGSPWQPWFYDWAFNLKRGPALEEKWALIPEGLDVLVTMARPRASSTRPTTGARWAARTSCAGCRSSSPGCTSSGTSTRAAARSGGVARSSSTPRSRRGRSSRWRSTGRRSPDPSALNVRTGGLPRCGRPPVASLFLRRPQGQRSNYSFFSSASPSPFFSSGLALTLALGLKSTSSSSAIGAESLARKPSFRMRV